MSLLLLGLMLLSACRTQSREVVSFDGWAKDDIPTVDPQTAGDVTSVDAVENLFIQLTNYDLQTSQIVPEAATRWEISDDGLTYTFALRSDIPWVHHDPAANETSQERDPQGQPRFVTAHDFVFGIKRACDPNTGSYYSTVFAPLLKGCSAVLFAEDPANIPQFLWDAVGVRALDDHTLVIQLEFPASYFLSMSAMWTLSAAPQWAIESHGKEWTEAGNIVTNGRYVLHEWEHDVQRTFLRNPLLPEDLRGDGNIERFVVSVVPDDDTGYSLWLDNKVDYSWIPRDSFEKHLQQFPQETDFIPDLSVYYISFRMSKPPFDDARVRRAFSAAFDRQTYVDKVLHGQGLPMIHFAPPGIFGAPPIDQVGLGFDPQFARQQLAEAGYPDCQGFPTVTLVGFSGKGSLLEFAQSQWVDHLGCPVDRIQIKELPFRDLLEIVESSVPDDQAPHMWPMGWAPDYPDENNWVGDVLWCEGANREKRTCNQIDELIVAARREQDLQRRVEMYHQIEADLFGPDGEIPFFPISLRTEVVARRTWLDRTPTRFGGEQWYTWTIDQAAKLKAQR